jgi:ubiquinone/menaquinone biosynthesis C-methylase UbiE
VPDNKSKRRHFFSVWLFLICSILILLAVGVLYSFINTLNRLDVVESERDQWQRPSEVLRAMDLREGNTVVDLGSGAGYFALKLASAVGKQGQVLAVDLRKLSLFFLWSRALLRGHINVHVVVGAEDNPRLPANAVDAVLICNTYHEFRNPEPILDHAFRSLRPGGRLVVVDRALRATEVEHAHEKDLSAVEDELQRNGFEIVSRDARFIDSPGDDLWWLLIGRKR